MSEEQSLYSAGPYSIGSKKWNGLSKVIEECGEVIQIAGKVIGSGGPDVSPWTNKDYKALLSEELADLSAAIKFFVEKNGLFIKLRTEEKYQRFKTWDEAWNEEQEKA